MSRAGHGWYWCFQEARLNRPAGEVLTIGKMHGPYLTEQAARHAMEREMESML